VVLKAFVLGPTETSDSIQYHITQEESITEEEFFSPVSSGKAEAMNKRKWVARRKHGQKLRKLKDRRRVERTKVS
jgi:hypothetical protein